MSDATTIYHPPRSGLPFLVVTFSGDALVAIPAQTSADARFLAHRASMSETRSGPKFGSKGCIELDRQLMSSVARSRLRHDGFKGRRAVRTVARNRYIAAAIWACGLLVPQGLASA
jgi:hypothetical protein